MPNLLPQNLLRANSLLPANHPIKEHAIDGMAIKNTDLAFPNADLFNADLCPVKMLGYLAWALSVDHWDDAWAESIKRDVCRASIETHQFKGTKHAVKLGLKALGTNIEMQEWFEYGGQPYHFRVDVFVHSKGFDAAAWDILDGYINDAKNVRSVLDTTRVYLSQTLSRATRLVPICGEIMTLMPPVLGNVDQALPHYAAMTTYDAETTSIYPQGAVI